MDATAADRLLDKLRRFAADELDSTERELLGALLAPGLELAYEDVEVEGFGLVWTHRQLPTSLAKAVRERHIEIVGL
jgi:hypothetical protein